MTETEPDRVSLTARLRRDLGKVESYAALIGILVGAGIFRVTTDAFACTGPSVILGYLVLAPIVLATSVAYVVFLSTPLGLQPGGEYTHIARTLGGTRIAFLGAWLKLIAYLGAGAFLATVLADYLLELDAMSLKILVPDRDRLPLALLSLLFFYAINCAGVRWFGRVQVAMCLILGVSILVLVLPGLLHIQLANYRPFFVHGATGFAAALPPLFFAYAGFESLAQTAGEVKDSTRELPRVYVRGIAITTLVFLAMSSVAFGVLPGAQIAGSTAPMADVANSYLPLGAAALVTVGGIMAVATSLNPSLLVPARLSLVLAEDGLLPAWIGHVHRTTGTPIRLLTVNLLVAATLLLSGQVALALNIAVLALEILYALHSLALILLPHRNPALYARVGVRVPLGLQRLAAGVSLLGMATLITVQVIGDVRQLRSTTLVERFQQHSLTGLELAVLWGVMGLIVYSLSARAKGATLASTPTRTEGLREVE